MRDPQLTGDADLLADGAGLSGPAQLADGTLVTEGVADGARALPGSGPPPLLAVAHGSRDPAAAATVAQLLGRVRDRASGMGFAGLPVATAYLDHSPPSPAQALAALAGRGARTVVVLPLLLTAAYHARTDIPAVLRTAAAAQPGLRIRYGDTLGPDLLLVRALERRLAEARVRIGDPGTAVVLAAAGSSDPGASAVISRLAADWQALRRWHAVVPAYASAARPTPAEAVAALAASGVPRVAVASYLLAPGLFAGQVRDESAAAGAAAVAGALGAAPELADLVLKRYAAAVAGLPRAPVFTAA